jgi:hypothetical protein
MRHASWFTTAVFMAVLLAGGTAWAGEVLVGVEPFEVDDAGNITKAAREKAIKEIESSVPGDEIWRLHLWAKLDKPAEGPLYLEFYRDKDGKKLMAHRVEIETFDGNKFFSMDVEISRTEGSFRIGEELEVAFVQLVGGKDAKKASGKIRLIASSKPVPTKPADGGGNVDRDREADEAISDAETKSDTPSSESSSSSEAPPPVESGDKKGCTIAAPAPAPWLALLGLVAIRRRRR